MKKLVIILFAAVSLSAFAADTTVKGYLVDLACAKEEGQKAGFGPNTPKAACRSKTAKRAAMA